MTNKLRSVFAVILVVLTVIGGIATFHGIGNIDPVGSKIQKGLDIEGGVYVVLEAKDTEGLSEEELHDQMERAKTVIENRVDSMGLTNPNVSIEGENRIRVELPGMENAEEAVELIGKTAQLQFVLADGSFILDGSSVKDASITTNSNKGGYAVQLEFNAEGAKAFTAATQTTSQGGVESTIQVGVDQAGNPVMAPNNSIVIALDDEVISFPTAEHVISQSSCIIEGNFTQEEAAHLAALIRGGALPVELEEISSSSQTATIGIDAYENSLKAGIIGLALIFLLMLIVYRGMGIAADLALVLYVILVVCSMAATRSVLTLPGIAGIILSIGMAVDANVIIFTRIKEEITSGASYARAVNKGYKSALSTVIDAQVTTLIASVILYQLGTSSVKGFAWTLMVGIICSIITAVFVTQLYLRVFSGFKSFAKPWFFGVKEGEEKPLKFRFNIIGHRKIYFAISAVIICAGLIVGMLGGFVRGIDFTGGTMVQMDMHKHVTEKQIEQVAKSEGINTSQMEIIYTGDKNEQAIIKTNENLNDKERASFVSALEKEFGTNDEDILASEHFGPTVGKELTKNAILSLFLAAAGMLIYIRIRFRKWKFGGAAILGILHDCFILVAFYGLFHITVNNPFIAAILTVAGYSINDTIVIFDRVRENTRLMRKESTETILDKSINQTLSRSIMTSFTTLIVMIPLIILGGPTLGEFVLPLMAGVIAGTYSSIFICSPLYYLFDKRK